MTDHPLLHVPYVKGDPDKLEPLAPPHLGGGRHRSHYDPGVVDWLRDTIGVRSMIDLGCGIGANACYARGRGVSVLTIDGDPYTAPDILHDFSTGAIDAPLPPVDLVWSMEFLEHVEEDHLEHVGLVFAHANYAAVTFAPPGAPGHHHVNCQDEHYWIAWFESLGFNHSATLTSHLRSVSQPGTIECSGRVRPVGKPFMRDRGLFFARGGR